MKHMCGSDIVSVIELHAQLRDESIDRCRALHEASVAMPERIAERVWCC